MIIKSAEFTVSNTKISKLPPPELAEYAFIGRSNVGKSSLLNMLCQRNALAHVSKEPGKTRAMNHFLINNSWYMVDLPGYGYAKLPQFWRKQWEEMTSHYMSQRPNLQCAFLLVDSCVPPQDIDLEFANKLGEWQTPFVIVFTKADRKKSHQNLKEGFLKQFEAAFLKSWSQMPQTFMTSAEDFTGRDEILHFIHNLNTQYKANV